MAHFAKLDENNNVIDVVVVDNGIAVDELSGVQFLVRLLGIGNWNWKQTSYNGNMRGRMASIGGTYDPVADVFINPCPVPGWILDQNGNWQPPTPLGQ